MLPVVTLFPAVSPTVVPAARLPVEILSPALASIELVAVMLPADQAIARGGLEPAGRNRTADGDRTAGRHRGERQDKPEVEVIGLAAATPSSRDEHRAVGQIDLPAGGGRDRTDRDVPADQRHQQRASLDIAGQKIASRCEADVVESVDVTDGDRRSRGYCDREIVTRQCWPGDGDVAKHHRSTPVAYRLAVSKDVAAGDRADSAEIQRPDVRVAEHDVPARIEFDDSAGQDVANADITAGKQVDRRPCGEIGDRQVAARAGIDRASGRDIARNQVIARRGPELAGRDRPREGDRAAGRDRRQREHLRHIEIVGCRHGRGTSARRPCRSARSERWSPNRP